MGEYNTDKRNYFIIRLCTFQHHLNAQRYYIDDISNKTLSSAISFVAKRIVKLRITEERKNSIPYITEPPTNNFTRNEM